MNDDQMDEMLIHGVRDYNAPTGSIPREEMWRRIESARAEARRRPDKAVIPIPRHETRRWKWSSIGVAAAAILAVGIAIGRYLDRAGSPGPTTVATTSATSAASPTDATPSPTKGVPAGGRATATDSSAAAVVHQLHEATKETDARVRALASAEPARTAARDRARTDVGATESAAGASGVAPNGLTAPQGQSLAYRLVVLQHLAGSEAMITSFRSHARSGQLDAELASWSRELLSTTRLLESSQASSDPVMKRLLDDLDLVISQIVQYTNDGATNSDELDLIEQSINKRGVMTKLRSTIPSRNFPAGT